MASLIKYIADNLDHKQFYEWLFPDIRWPEGSNEARVFSPLSDEEDPSFNINKVTGEWFCHSSKNREGGSPCTLYARLKDCSQHESAVQLYHQFIHPIIPEKQIAINTPHIINHFARIFLK